MICDFCVVFVSWLDSRTCPIYVLVVLQSEPPRLATHTDNLTMKTTSSNINSDNYDEGGDDVILSLLPDNAAQEDWWGATAIWHRQLRRQGVGQWQIRRQRPTFWEMEGWQQWSTARAANQKGQQASMTIGWCVPTHLPLLPHPWRQHLKEQGILEYNIIINSKCIGTFYMSFSKSIVKRPRKEIQLINVL